MGFKIVEFILMGLKIVEFTLMMLMLICIVFVNKSQTQNFEVLISCYLIMSYLCLQEILEEIKKRK